jgi:hypothetical protein
MVYLEPKLAINVLPQIPSSLREKVLLKIPTLTGTQTENISNERIKNKHSWKNLCLNDLFYYI